MPVTAKLSRHFYQQLGDEAANELVEWFNAVDTSYQMQLRELNDLNYARFSSEMQARFAELRAEMDARFSQQDAKMERRFAQQDTKWTEAFTRLETRITWQMMGGFFTMIAVMIALNAQVFHR